METSFFYYQSALNQINANITKTNVMIIGVKTITPRLLDGDETIERACSLQTVMSIIRQ